MKRFTLYAGLLVAWAAILVAGVGVFLLHQDPAVLAQSLSAHASDAGIRLSIQKARLALFPPSVALTGVVARTPEATVFIESCTAQPDLWALVQGNVAFTGLRLDSPEVLLSAEPPARDLSGSAKEAKDTPSASDTVLPAALLTPLPDWLSGMRLDIVNGSVRRTGDTSAFSLSGLSVSCRFPRADHPGELELKVQRLDPGIGLAPLPKPFQTLLHDLRLAVTEWRYADGQSPELAGNVSLSFPLPLTEQGRITITADTLLSQETFRIDGVAESQGTLSVAKQRIPMECRIPFSTAGTVAPRQPLPDIVVKDASLALDKDTARLTGTLSAHGQDNTFPRLEGTLSVERLSLPRWFGFARDLPPGVQTALDNLSGTLTFSLTPASLVVTKAKAKALDVTFTGTAGVRTFAAPVIDIGLNTTTADLDVLFPQIRGKQAHTPTYKMPPLVSDSTDTKTSLGYDIRLSAQKASFWKWSGREVAVRIAPAEKTGGTEVAIRCNSLYGGKAQASLFPQKDLRIVFTGDSLDADKLITPLAGFTALTGKLSLSGTLSGNTTTPLDFLASLRGSVDARAENGRLTLGGTPRSFTKLGLSFQGQGNGTPKDLAYNGQWNTSLADETTQGALALTGTVRFPLPLSVQITEAPATISLSGKSGMGRTTGMFSLDSAAGTLRMRGQGQAGLPTAPFELSGEVQGSHLNSAPVWEGNLSLRTDNLRTALALSPAFQSLRQAEANTRFRLDQKQLHLSDLRGRFGHTTFSGNLNRQETTPPIWTGSLDVDVFNLSTYLPETKKGAATSASPWPTEWLRRVSLDVGMRIGQLTIAGIRHDAVNLPLSVKNGILTADPITARVAGGTAGAGLKIEALTTGLLSRLRYTLTGVDMLTLSKERGQSGLVSGQGQLDADINGIVHSADSIPGALNGSLHFAIKNGHLDAQNPGPLSRFNSFSTSGSLARGILTTPNLSLEGNLTVNGYGTLNLNAQTLDYQLNVKMPGLPDIPVTYTGSLDNPRRNVNATGMLSSAVGQLGNGILHLLDSALSVPFGLLTSH